MLARKPKLRIIAGVFAVSFGAAPASMLMASPARLNSIETVDVAPRVFAYRPAGDFSQAVAVARASVLHIMKQQVTMADYDRCVAETKCKARSPLESFDPNRFDDDALSVGASRDPSVRWLVRYDWISDRALPEPSARMNTVCSIYLGMSGNGRTSERRCRPCIALRSLPFSPISISPGVAAGRSMQKLFEK